MAIPAAMLSDRCTIRRKSETGVGVAGKKTRAFSDLATDVPCKFYGYNRGSERFSDRQIARDDVQFGMSPGQDVTVKDRILFNSQRFEVSSVRPVTGPGGIHHQQVFVTLVEESS